LTKKAVQFGDQLICSMLDPIPHHQFVFNISKFTRGHFGKNEYLATININHLEIKQILS